jgi:hypothetical protein
MFITRIDCGHALARDDAHSEPVRFASQSIQYGTGAIGVGKQLSTGLDVQRNAKFPKELDSLLDWKCAEHTANDVATAAPKVLSGNYVVGDIATTAARDQYLCTQPLRAIYDRNFPVRVAPRRKNRRREPGCAATNNCAVIFG